jgi:hypothetical protein
VTFVDKKINYRKRYRHRVVPVEKLQAIDLQWYSRFKQAYFFAQIRVAAAHAADANTDANNSSVAYRTEG